MTDTVQNALQWDHPAAAHGVILDADGALIDWQGRKKVAIVGFASSSRDLAPFHDPEYVILALNQLYRHIPRADGWFDIHHDFNAKEKVVEGTDYDTWLRTVPIPVFLTQRQDWIPTSVTYPLPQILAKWNSDYFRSSISYMIAYAIWAGFTTIGLWGVDLVAGSEYEHQKANAEFWLGMANALGIEIVLPEATALCKQPYRYGYEAEPATGFVKLSMMEERLKKYAQRRLELVAELQTLDGAMQEADYLRQFIELRARGADIKG